jgi:hypothetical protein
MVVMGKVGEAAKQELKLRGYSPSIQELLGHARSKNDGDLSPRWLTRLGADSKSTRHPEADSGGGGPEMNQECDWSKVGDITEGLCTTPHFWRDKQTRSVINRCRHYHCQ